MAESIITRRGGEVLSLPILNPSYPQDAVIDLRLTTTAIFSISFSEIGNPPEYIYEWYYDDTLVEGATNNTYIISNISSTGVHDIYCKIIHKKGEVISRKATLTVIHTYTPSNISINATSTSLMEGSSVTLTANIGTAGNPTNYIYNWYWNNTLISGATDASLSINNLTKNISGHTAYCTVTNSAGTVKSSSVTIVVIGKLPSVTSTSGCTYTTEDATAGTWNIECTSTGSFTLDTPRVVDIWLVGGGGGAGYGYGGGAGGGYTTTKKAVTLAAGTHSFIIGAGGSASGATGGTTQIGSYSAAGGQMMPYDYLGGNGGSGGGGGTTNKYGYTGSNAANRAGNGGTNGGNGNTGYRGSAGGRGQGTSTRPYGASSGTIYGGGGGASGRGNTAGGVRGDASAGNGGSDEDYFSGTSRGYHPYGNSGVANRGGGGGRGRGDSYGGAGGSGIILIRSAR